MKKNSTENSLNINSYYDIIVAGGGPAGCLAAAAAAKSGAKVLLIEASYALGGMSTEGMVPSFAPFSDKKNVIVNPLTKRLITSYKEKMGYEASHWDWIPISFEDLMEVYDSFVEESGADVLFGGTVCGAVKNKTGIEYIEVAGKFGIKAFKAKTYIDCTGDADLAAFSGLDYEMGDGSGNLQASSLCFIISGIDAENMNFWDIHWNDNSIWAKNGNNPKYPLIDINHVVPSVIGKGTMAFNAGHLFSADTTDESKKSLNMIKGRKTARQYLNALKEYYPQAFKNAYLCYTAPLLGVRESRRIKGEYVLTLDDYKNRRTFTDGIAKNCYWIDCHRSCKEQGSNCGMAPENYKSGESHEIPWRCLFSKKADNLLVAGRAVSADRAVSASVRVIPVCMSVGEAAGLGAVEALKKGIPVTEVKGEEIKKLLNIDLK